MMLAGMPSCEPGNDGKRILLAARFVADPNANGGVMRKQSHLSLLFLLVFFALFAGCENPSANNPAPGANDPAPDASHTVSFDSNGGSAVPSQTVESGDKAARPADPTNDPHSFLGWYKGSNPYDFSAPVTSDITLTAKWTRTVTVEDSVRYESSNTFRTVGGNMDFTEVGYVTLDFTAGTFENYWVREYKNGALTDENLVYASGTFSSTSTAINFDIKASVIASYVGQSTSYTVDGNIWTYAGSCVFQGFGNVLVTTTSVTKAVLASHTVEE